MRRLLLLAFVVVPLAVLGQGRRDDHYQEPAELARLIQARGQPGAEVYYLVDVRTPEEYAAGHLPTAINIPNTEIGLRPPSQDKDALIVVYCASGRRSAASKKVLDDLGYTRVVDFGARSRWTGVLVQGDRPTLD